jgi:TonB family protein
MSDLNNDIEKYLRGELTPAEMHALEKKALSDPFLADALEGASSISHEDLLKDIDELNRSLVKKKNAIFTPLRIAAGIVVVIGVSMFFVLTAPNEQKEIAQLEAPQEEVKDTIEIKIPTQERKTKKIKPREEHLAQETPTTIPYSLEADTTIQEPEFAQEIIQEPQPSHIYGTVIAAEDGLPLAGVSVIAKGTTQGTVTDVNGNYSLNVPDSTTLAFSFIGMQPTEALAKKDATTDVKLSEDVSQLSEVVITRAPLPKNDADEPVIQLAEPVGGLRAYDKYLEDNKTYPQQALDNDVKGRVIVGFDVSIRGELDNFVVIRSIGYGLDEEVIRLVKEGPQWRPTTEDGKAVESTVHVKMKFDARKFKARKKK